MPSKALKPCARYGCPALTRNLFCPEHARAETRQYDRYGRSPGSRERYTGAWRRIRASFLLARPLCELCQSVGRTTPATLVHHRVKLTDGGTNDRDNLQALCAGCHSRLHAKHGDYF